jgi:hypothetical protein
LLRSSAIRYRSLPDSKCAEAGLYTDFVSEEKANLIIFTINLGKVPQEETALKPGEDFSPELDPGGIVRPGTCAERELLNLALVSPGVLLPAGNIGRIRRIERATISRAKAISEYENPRNH